MKNYKNLMFFLAIILLIILLLNYFAPTLGTFLTSVLTTLTTIAGIFSVFYEMKRAADIDESNFILSLFKYFTSSDTPGISISYGKLDELFSTGNDTIEDEDRKFFVEYLQFFEMLVSLVSKDIISLDDVDSLFGYWFFIAVNCEKVQKMELLPNREYYEGIFKIYGKWVECSKKNGRPIPFKETPLLKD